MANQARADLLQGTLDLLVLKVLHLGPMHGWGITERIERSSDDVLKVGQGSLYPALYRLESQGAITSSWGTTENNRRARYYQITPLGKQRLVSERREWRRVSDAIELILALSKA